MTVMCWNAVRSLMQYVNKYQMRVCMLTLVEDCETFKRRLS